MKKLSYLSRRVLMGLAFLGCLDVAAATESPASSPAQLQIDAALSALKVHPGVVKSYNSLAVGLTRRARETGDVGYYERALQALEEARQLDPGNRESQRISAWIAMGRHEFARAYEIARGYDRLHPEDSSNLSVLGDALMELGRYAAAEKAYQRMVDLKPGPTAYCRVAYLREVRGDLTGADAMMRMALAATDSREREDRAWLLVQIAHLQEISGDSSGAEAGYRQALAAFPGYHYALAGLAEIELRRGRDAEAESLARQAIEAAPHAERYLVLADALRLLGRGAEAAEAEAQFERLAAANVDKTDNENHDLVLFYLERRRDPARALTIARLEAARRQDVVTLDRLAIALSANGEAGRARRVMRRVIAVGTRDPLIAAHAAALGIPPRS